MINPSKSLCRATSGRVNALIRISVTSVVSCSLGASRAEREESPAHDRLTSTPDCRWQASPDMQRSLRLIAGAGRRFVSADRRARRRSSRWCYAAPGASVAPKAHRSIRRIFRTLVADDDGFPLRRAAAISRTNCHLELSTSKRRSFCRHIAYLFEPRSNGVPE
jgi:hypothetical protein